MSTKLQNDFNDVSPKFAYVVQVYDYISEKTYDSKKEFDTYEDAKEYLQNYDFISVFGEAPIGLSIIQVPKVTFGNIDFGGTN